MLDSSNWHFMRVIGWWTLLYATPAILIETTLLPTLCLDVSWKWTNWQAIQYQLELLKSFVIMLRSLK
jgi:hypothetical protein